MLQVDLIGIYSYIFCVNSYANEQKCKQRRHDESTRTTADLIVEKSLSKSQES